MPNTASRADRPKAPAKTTVNFCLDAFLLLLFLTVLWVNFVLRFVFPSPASSDGWKLWNLSYTQWTDLQFALMCLLAFSVLVHVMLHWTWVCGVIAKWFFRGPDGRRRMVDNGTRTLWGVGLLIVLLHALGIAFAAAMMAIKSPV